MPKVGEKEYPYTFEGIQAAKKDSLESGIPMSNAMERTQNMDFGAMYKEGGKVKMKYKGLSKKVKGL